MGALASRRRALQSRGLSHSEGAIATPGNVVDRRHARHNFSQPAMGPALASRLPGGPGPPAPSRPSHSRSSRVTGCPPVPVTWHLAQHKPVGRHFGEMSFSASSGASATGRAGSAGQGRGKGSLPLSHSRNGEMQICAASIFSIPAWRVGTGRPRRRGGEADDENSFISRQPGQICK